jgi:malonate-semialdehyde dehydrogenase (acetylating)/methylmalonate-semialdehyde dehydrogenase
VTASFPPAFAGRSYDFSEYAPAKNWIGGEWSDARSGQTLPVENPRYGRAMCHVTMSGAGEVDAAVAAAARAFPAWRDTPIKQRAEVMYRLKQLMTRDREELAWLVTHENGKLFPEALASVDKSIECVEFGAALPNAGIGGTLEVSRGVTCTETHEPLGVVAGVTPFNFPIMVPLWMIPQALVGGNAFILKPSEQVPLGAMRLAALLKEAGLPDGVFNVVNGGPHAVTAIVDHPGIKAFAFVGSTPIAKMLYARGAQTGRPMLCLGGAKNHLIVVPDADPKLTADNVVASFTGCSGQRCMAASVLVAVGDVQPILDGIFERAAKMVPGKDLGPIINAKSLERIRSIIAASEKSGVRLAVDGRNKSGDPGGYWMGPTIMDGVTTSMPAWKEEIFGPVLSIVRVKSLEQALEVQHSCAYANGACIYTTSGAVAEQFVSRVEAGMVGVNVGVPVPREPFGFGGWKDSRFGHGNITGMDGFHFWTRPRKVTAKWTLRSDNNWMS